MPAADRLTLTFSRLFMSAALPLLLDLDRWQHPLFLQGGLVRPVHVQHQAEIGFLRVLQVQRRARDGEPES